MLNAFVLIVLIALFNIHGVLVNNVNLSSAYAAAAGSEAGQIIELLQTKQILTLTERSRLSGLINGFAASAHGDLSALRDLSLKIMEKIDNDKNGLQYLLLNLEKLANSEYARTRGVVKESDLKRCRDMLERLERDIEAARSRFPPPQKYRDTGYYSTMIKDNSALLIGGGNLVAVPDLWESIRKTAKPVYISWNREYIDLLEKLKKHQKSFYSPSDFLTYQEMRFVEMFGLVQSDLRMLSESSSPDF